MGLTNENVGPKILAKIKIYDLTRAELLFTLCYEIPCNRTKILKIISLDFGRNDVFMKSFRFLLTFNNPSLEVLQQHAGLLHFALQLLDGIIHNRLLSQFWST